MDDADLYGDLYGADEYDDDANDSSTTKSATGHAVKATETPKDVKSDFKDTKDLVKDQPPTAMPKATTTAAVPQPTPPTSSIPVHIQSKVDQTPPQPIQSIAGTSSIPTYSGNDDYSAYSQHGAQQNGSNYAGAQDFDRGDNHTVRPSEMRDEGKMFVGGLNWETTNESLENYFSQFGKIDACTIMRDGAGRSRGFAFLTFEDAAAVNAVMVREHYLDGKIIDPKRAIPRLEHQRTQKIFVGGLAPSVTAETLKSFFSQHGRVVDATVMVDRDSSRSKGFGFVTFEDGTGVEKLVGHGMVIDGKGIEVKLAQPRHAQQREQPTNGGAVGGGGGGYTTPGGGSTGNGASYQSGRTGDAYNNTNGANGAPSANGGGSAPAFDAQAMANLYQRMMAVGGGGGNFMGANPMMGGAGAGAMNPMMMGGMGMGRGMPGNMMGGGPGMGMGGMPGMGMGGMAPGAMMGGGMGMMGGGPMGAMGRGGPMGMGGGMGGMGGGHPMAGTAGGMGGQIPRGPRAGMQQAQQHPGGPQGGGAGPMRSHGMRGQNTYHPYGR